MSDIDQNAYGAPQDDYPAPPPEQNFDPFKRPEPKKSGILGPIVIGFAAAAVIALAAWGLTAGEPAVSGRPPSSATPETPVPSPATRLPLNKDQLQFQANRLLSTYLTQPNALSDATAALQQAHGDPAGCLFGIAGAATKDALVQAKVAESILHFRRTVPEGYGAPTFALSRFKGTDATAWILLAQTCR